MSNLAPILDHTAQAQARTLTVTRPWPNFQALVGVLGDQFQGVEDALFALISARFLATATGRSLDGLGEIIGLPRGGLDDETYRVLLYGTLAQNNSRCDLSTLETVSRAVFEAQASFVISPFCPGRSPDMACASINVQVANPKIPYTLYPTVTAIVQNSVAAAVSVSTLDTTYGAQGLCLSGGGSPLGMGLGDANVPGSGGRLASNIYTARAT